MFLTVPTYARVDIHVYLPWSAVCTVHRFINLSLNILKHTVKLYLSILTGIDVYTVHINMNSHRKYRCVKSLCTCMQ